MRCLEIDQIKLYKKLKNNQSIIIDIPNIGSICFETTKRAKHINISIKPPNKVRVAVPKQVSLSQAIEFTKKKETWINKTIIKLTHRFKEQKQLPAIDVISGSQFLINRINELADKYGFIFNKVSIRNQKTRWGSCSKNNNISLNIQLMRLSNSLIDYVILHELVHTIVKNHSILFWNTLCILYIFKVLLSHKVSLFALKFNI